MLVSLLLHSQKSCGAVSSREEELTDRRNERALVLLRRQHEDREDQLRSQEHLDKKPLRYGRASSKAGLHVQGTWKHTLHERARHDTTENLTQKQQPTSHPGKSADEAHSESNGGVEQAAADTEEHPCVDRKRESEAKRNVLQLLWIRAGLLHGQAG